MNQSTQAPSASPPQPAPFSLGNLRELFPWTDDQLKLGKPLEYLWSCPIDAPVESVWPLVSDTSRLNRTLGLPELNYTEVEGVMHGAARYWGVAMQWIEPSWTWVANRQMLCVRNYSRGFARVFRGGCVLKSEGRGRTRVYLYFAWIPRGLHWRLFLGRMFPKMEPVYLKALKRMERHLADPAKCEFHRRPSQALADAASARLAEGRKKMLAARVAPDLVERWTDLIAHGDPMDLNRIRPKTLAADWALPARQVTESALIGVESGLLLMHWDIICPHCRGSRASLNSLSQLPVALRCEACRIEFDPRVKDSIEVTFQPHTSVRETKRLFYCSAEPARKAHVLIQQDLTPGASAVLSPALAPGRYYGWMSGRGDRFEVEVSDDGPLDPVESIKSLSASMLPESLRLDSADRLRFINDSVAPATFNIGRAGADDSVRLGDLLSIPAFKRLYGADSLPVNAQLEIGVQTIVIVDVVDSTSLFVQYGDARAFGLINDWFHDAAQAAERFDGSLIKTIGDAAVLLFPSTLSGVQAAVELQRRAQKTDWIRVRVAAHSGACLAVRLNAGMDVFGWSVILAANLLDRAEEGEVVLSSAIAAQKEVADWLAFSNLASRSASFEIESLGMSEPARILKIEE